MTSVFHFRLFHGAATDLAAGNDVISAGHCPNLRWRPGFAQQESACFSANGNRAGTKPIYTAAIPGAQERNGTVEDSRGKQIADAVCQAKGLGRAMGAQTRCRGGPPWL